MRTLAVVAASSLLIALGQSVVAAGDARAADVFVVHGIPGADLGAAPALPVDIAVDGECTLEDVEFGEIAGPVELDPGRYEVGISLAGAAEPCGGTLAVVGDVAVALTETAAVVAHLDVNGAPRVTKFSTNVAPTDGDARVTVYHTAAAPAVDIRVIEGEAEGGTLRAITFGLENGDQTFPRELAPGDHTVLVSASTPRRAQLRPPVLPPIGVTLEGDTAYAAFAVGSLANDTLDVLLLTVPITAE